ncbi:hypothetical protein BKA61DRAFT_673810 [Leptodontidium sp. MPI-SDFR-AT-0119]|nr:hypothetical protein BKA61DRAFT_673810 [Leptodontidium sp. MPI-SDFR-AT-0119]
MATFAFKPYTYVPTPPRSKSTTTRRKPAPEQASIFDKLQRIKSSNTSLSTPRPPAVADNGGYMPEIRATGYDEAVCDSYSDDELNDTELDEDDETLRPVKRKRPFSSRDSLMPKKPKHSYSSRVTATSNTEVRLPSPAPSALHATDTNMSSYCYNLGRLSSDILLTLTDVTFHPHSSHYYSFTVVVRDACDGRGVSFSQVARLIEGIGHVGKIDDFTIKPMEQHLFLLTGFSRHTSSQPSSGGGTVSTTEVGRIHGNTTRTRPQDGRAVDAGALASRSEPSISDDDGRLSDSDPESSSDDDGCSSGDEQGRLNTSKHSRWNPIDEQRLLAYKKEGKP